MEADRRDRFGLGWRRELAAGILSHLDEIEVVEVLADDYVGASRRERRALATLARQVPVTVHGTSLGLASTEAVSSRRLDRLARLIDEIEPIAWSEHLAFVRGGGVEIGHLAAPPRREETLDGLLANVERARNAVGSRPLLENVATLVEPPHSTLPEDVWVARSIAESGASMLLDLHNLHANATNFGFDPVAYLRTLPLDRVTQIHVAGGRWIERHGTRRLLDDHLHDVPDPVFELLAEVARRAPGPLTVILERDGRYTPIEALLAELARARRVVTTARETHPVKHSAERPRVAPPTSRRRPRWPVGWWRSRDERSAGPDSLEAMLARVYVDDGARERFLATEAYVDHPGLAMAAESYARKRERPR